MRLLIINTLVLDGKLKEIPLEISTLINESKFLIDRINSKLIDISDSLRLVSDSLIGQKGISKPNTYRSPEKTQEIAGVGIFSKVLEAAQLLRDQIEEGADQSLLIEQSRALYQDLFILLQGLRQVDIGRKIGEITPNVSHFVHSLDTYNTRSPSKVFVRDTLFRAHEEISGQLRHSVASLQVSNINEITQQLQLQIERNNELGNKYEAIQKAFHTVSLIINEEITRCLMSFDDVLSIASDNVLVLKLKRDLSNFRTQIGDLFARQGHYYAPQKIEIYTELERQRAAWEASLTKQKESFAEEVKKIEQARRREEEALKREKELSSQTIAKLEHEVKSLSQEKHRLGLELEQLKELLNDEEALAKDAQAKYQQDLDLQKKAKTALEVQIHELQKLIKDKEKSVLESSHRVAELQNKCKELERGTLRLAQEIELLQKDKVVLTEQLALNESTFREIGKRTEIFEQQIRLLESEREELQNNLCEKETAYEVDREQLSGSLERVQTEYKEFVEKTQKKQAEIKQEYEAMIDDLTKQLEQVKSDADALRIEKELELRGKRDELRDLNTKYQSLEDLFKHQEANLKKKDEKLTTLIAENDHLQEKTHNLDLITKEAARTQEKSKKYFDLLTNANEELANLKSEFQFLTHEKKSDEQRLEALEEERKQLREEVDELKEKLTRTNQKLSDSVNELKDVKAQLEGDQQLLSRKEKQLK